MSDIDVAWTAVIFALTAGPVLAVLGIRLMRKYPKSHFATVVPATGTGWTLVGMLWLWVLLV